MYRLHIRGGIYIKKSLCQKPFRRFLVERALRKLDGCIVTNSSYKPEVPYVRVPDYYITDEIKKYQNRDKVRRCVCLGEIRKEKDVVGLVRVMNKTSISLLIAGSFQDEKIYHKVKKIKGDNITIENKNIPYRVYMEYLSKYKYLILPYDPKFYSIKTSGVLLEGIFVGAIPIAPNSLLKQHQIQGLGYQDIKEIPELINLYENGEITVENHLEKYQYESYKNKIIDFFEEFNLS